MRFTLSSSPVLSAPFTAVATFYGLLTEETTLANKTYFAHFAELETLVSAAPGHIATAAGFTVKAIDGSVGAGSEKARAYMVVIGWESLELHQEFMGVEAAGAVFGKMAAQAEGWSCGILGWIG